jgi:hypothetical protein
MKFYMEFVDQTPPPAHAAALEKGKDKHNKHVATAHAEKVPPPPPPTSAFMLHAATLVQEAKVAGLELLQMQNCVEFHTGESHTREFKHREVGMDADERVGVCACGCV